MGPRCFCSERAEPLLRMRQISKNIGDFCSLHQDLLIFQRHVELRKDPGNEVAHYICNQRGILISDQWTPKRLERYRQAEFWSLYGGWHAGHPQSSLTIKHYNTRVFLPYMAAPSGGNKFGFTQSYGRSYGGIVPVFIEFTASDQHLYQNVLRLRDVSARSSKKERVICIGPKVPHNFPYYKNTTETLR